MPYLSEAAKAKLFAFDPDKLLTRKETAEYLGISVSTLATWASAKRYNLQITKIGSKVRYRVKHILSFLEDRTIGCAPVC